MRSHAPEHILMWERVGWLKYSLNLDMIWYYKLVTPKITLFSVMTDCILFISYLWLDGKRPCLHPLFFSHWNLAQRCHLISSLDYMLIIPLYKLCNNTCLVGRDMSSSHHSSSWILFKTSFLKCYTSSRTSFLKCHTSFRNHFSQQSKKFLNVHSFILNFPALSWVLVYWV